MVWKTAMILQKSFPDLKYRKWRFIKRGEFTLYKKLLAWFVAVLFTLSIAATVSAAGTVQLYAEGRQIGTEHPPQIKNDRLFVPVSVVSDALHVPVSRDNRTKQALGETMAFRIFSTAYEDEALYLVIMDGPWEQP